MSSYANSPGRVVADNSPKAAKGSEQEKQFFFPTNEDVGEPLPDVAKLFRIAN